MESTQTEPVFALDVDVVSSYKTLCPRDGMSATLTGSFPDWSCCFYPLDGLPTFPTQEGPSYFLNKWRFPLDQH